MQCPECKLEMRIVNSSNVLKNGELYVCHEIACTNLKCTKHDEVIKVLNKQDLIVVDN